MITFKKCLVILLWVIVAGPAHAVAKTNGAKETVLAFRDAINAHDVVRITALMASGHVFVDAIGNELAGKEKAAAAWEAYFKLYPNYHVEFTEFFVHGDTVAVFGFALGSYKGSKENYWHRPASWRAVAHGQQVKLWQAYGEAQMTTGIAAQNNAASGTNSLPRVTGIGGLFFKCKDAKALREWYKQHLGLDTNPYGAKFDWRLGDDPSKYGCTQWSPFGEKTTYFAPSTKDFMVNYRVNNLELLVEQLRKGGITIVDTIEATDYGKFVHILDCEQNKVELWEPKDADYDKVVGGYDK